MDKTLVIRVGNIYTCPDTETEESWSHQKTMIQHEFAPSDVKLSINGSVVCENVLRISERDYYDFLRENPGIFASVRGLTFVSVLGRIRKSDIESIKKAIDLWKDNTSSKYHDSSLEILRWFDFWMTHTISQNDIANIEISYEKDRS